MKHLIWIMFAAGLAMAQRSEELFQQALMKERSQGDLKGAIEIYQRIAKDKDRKLAARALLEMARCQEKQGGEAARKTYERLVKEFGDQAEAVAMAKSRMSSIAATVAAGTGPRVRQVWAGDAVDDEGSVSPDGRFLTYAHWDTGDLGVRDLATNTSKLLTNTGGWEKSGGEFAQDSRYSPDGKRIAYNWFLPKRGASTGGYELRIMNSDGSGVRAIGWNGGRGYPVPLCWSADGKLIAVADFRSDGREALYTLDVVTGHTKELIAPGASEGGLHVRGEFSPDGRWIAFARGRSREIFVVSVSGGIPAVVAPHPAEDAYPSWSRDGKNVLFLSNRSGSYGIWQVPVADGRQAGSPKNLRSDLGQTVRGVGFLRSGAYIYSVENGGMDVYGVALDRATGRAAGAAEIVSDRRPGANVFPALAANGGRIAFSTGATAINEATAVTVRDLTSGSEKLHVTQRGTAYFWHPDNRRLVLIERAKELDMRDLVWLDSDTGERKPFISIGPTRNPHLPVFSGDGQTLYYVFREWPKDEFVVIAMTVASGEKRILYRTPLNLTDGRPIGMLRGLALSPDGKVLATVRTGPDGQIEYVLIPAAGGASRMLAAVKEASARILQPSFAHDGRSIYVVRSPNDQTHRTSEIMRLDILTGAFHPIGIQMRGISFLNADSSGNAIYFQAGDRQSEIWLAENIIPAQ